MGAEPLAVPEAVAPPAFPPATTELPGGEVHVWHASLDEGCGPSDRDLLDAAERARADRLHTEKLKARFTRSRALLRMILSSYVERAPETLRFEEGPEGKPRLTEPHGVRFNLSHSGSVWMLATASDREVGIDVERITRRLDLEGVARRMFPPDERDTLLALPEEAQKLAFFRCWATREAIVKGMGVGMFTVSERFEIDADPNAALRVRSRSDFPWRVGVVPAPPGFVSVLAVDGVPERIRSWSLSSRDTLADR
jgi:4'-phosphopantetheinyl transferase